jgi:site-specific DNA-methyltransferase (adenine-specific)
VAIRRIIRADNLDALATLAAGSVRLCYIDPPFNTGKTQQRRRIKVTRDPGGQRRGFSGQSYAVTALPSGGAYIDGFNDYIAYLAPRLIEIRRVLADDGSLFVHVDPRESHYVKVLLDQLFGRESFKNEIVWAYDYGGRPKNRWPAKHDTILWYAKDPARYVFRYDDIDRVPYLAEKLVGLQKAARGKVPTDVWWNTIVSPTGKEKTGYPTQKPLAIIERIVRVHSDPGDVVLDCFAGSGTTGEAAAMHDRGFILIDESRDAVKVMKKRLEAWAPAIG